MNSENEVTTENSIQRLKQKYINKTREAMLKRSNKRSHDLSYHSFSSRSQHASIINAYKRKIEDLLLNNNDLAKSLESARLEISRLEQELESVQRQLSLKLAVQSKLTKVSGNLSIIASVIADTVTSIMDAKQLLSFSSDNLSPDTILSSANLSKSFDTTQPSTNFSFTNYYCPIENGNAGVSIQRNVWKPSRQKVIADMSTIAEMSAISEEITRNLAVDLENAGTEENISDPKSNTEIVETGNIAVESPADNIKKLSVDNVSAERQTTPQNKELDTSRETPKTPVLSSNLQFLPSLIPKPVRQILLRKQKLLNEIESSADDVFVSEKDEQCNKKIDKTLERQRHIVNKVKIKQLPTKTNENTQMKIPISDNDDDKVTVNSPKRTNFLMKCHSNNETNSHALKTNDYDDNSVSNLNDNSLEIFKPLINRKTFFIPNKSPISLKRKTYVIAKGLDRLDSIHESDMDIPTKKLQQKNSLLQNKIFEDVEGTPNLSPVTNTVNIAPNRKRETIILSHPINRIDELSRPNEFYGEGHESTTPKSMERLSSGEELDNSNLSLSQKQKTFKHDKTILKTVDMEFTEVLSIPSGFLHPELFGIAPDSKFPTTAALFDGKITDKETQSFNSEAVPVVTQKSSDVDIALVSSISEGTKNNDSIICETDQPIHSDIKPSERRLRQNAKLNYAELINSLAAIENIQTPTQKNKGLKKLNGKLKTGKKDVEKISKVRKDSKKKISEQGKIKKNSVKEGCFNEVQVIQIKSATDKGKNEILKSRKRKSDIYNIFEDNLSGISPYKSIKDQIIEDKHNASCELFVDKEENTFPNNSEHISTKSSHIITPEKPKTFYSAKISQKKKTKIKKPILETNGNEKEQSLDDFCIISPLKSYAVRDSKKRGRPKKPLTSCNVDNRPKDGILINDIKLSCSPVVQIQNLLSPMKENLGPNFLQSSFELVNDEILKVTSPTGQSLNLTYKPRKYKSINLRTPQSRQGSISQYKNNVSGEKSHSTINTPSTTDSGRRRRHKPVSYQEPKLGTKMRRP